MGDVEAKSRHAQRYLKEQKKLRKKQRERVYREKKNKKNDYENES